ITILLTPIRVIIDNLVISASPDILPNLGNFWEWVDKFRLLLWLPGAVRARKRAGWDSNPRFAAPQAAVLVLARLPALRTSTKSFPYNELSLRRFLLDVTRAIVNSRSAFATTPCPTK